jgi:hypothetical protein
MDVVIDMCGASLGVLLRRFLDGRRGDVPEIAGT